MSEHIIFIPIHRNATLFDTIMTWIVVAVFAVCVFIYLIVSNSNNSTTIVFVFAFIFMLIALLDRRPVSITLSSVDKTLEYCYKNCWGEEKKITLDLTKSGGHYKFEILGKTSSGWRLLLYEGNYFHKRLSIVAKDKGGFSKAQLDKIVAMIVLCKKSSLIFS